MVKPMTPRRFRTRMPENLLERLKRLIRQVSAKELHSTAERSTRGLMKEATVEELSAF